MDSELGVLGILQEASRLPCRNKKIMLPVMLLAIVPSSLLSLGNYISMYPLLVNFIIMLYLVNKQDPNTPQFYDTIIGIRTHAEAFLQVYQFFIVASYILSFFSTLLVVLASSAAYSGKELTLDELSSRIRGSWKGLLLTKLYFTLLTVGYTVLSVSSIAVFMLNSEGSSSFVAGLGVLGLLARLLYVYLAMVWMVALVISVLEDGCYGLAAFSKAAETVKGRRGQGFAIAIILLLLDAALTGGFGIGVTKVHPQVGAARTTGLIVISVLLLLKVFSLMVYTVYYYDCKKSHGGKFEEDRELAYTRVKTTPSVGEEGLP